MAGHPLRKDPRWRFRQPSVAVKSAYTLVNPKTKSRRLTAISGSSVCREGTIGTLRRAFVRKIARAGPHPRGWGIRHVKNREVDLLDPRAKRAGRTTLTISAGSVGRSIRNFLYVADAIMGPIGVLLNPDRPRGCCCPSVLVKDANRRGISWEGIDNTILYSPALVSMMSGLYRQCALLCEAGYAKEILSQVDRREVRRIIERNDTVAAREMIRRLRRWIEVPIPRGGCKDNMPFPFGYFYRLNQVISAVEKHGTHAVFSRGFLASWALSPQRIRRDGLYSGGASRGMWSSWGDRKKTKAYQQIADLAKGRKRSRPAPKAS